MNRLCGVRRLLSALRRNIVSRRTLCFAFAAYDCYIPADITPQASSAVLSRRWRESDAADSGISTAVHCRGRLFATFCWTPPGIEGWRPIATAIPPRFDLCRDFIERCERVAWPIEFGRGEVLAQMGDGRGAGNEQDVGCAAEQPSGRHLHRRGAE